MTDQIQSAVTELLEQHTIPYDVITIPLSEDKKPIRELEQWLISHGRDPAAVVRSLLFRCGSGAFALLAAAGGGRADWATLRKQLNERKLTMADFDEVEQATGYVVGAVPPIALPSEVTTLLDNSIARYDDVIIGSGVLGYAIGVSSQDLQKMMAAANRGDFIKT